MWGGENSSWPADETHIRERVILQHHHRDDLHYIQLLKDCVF
jgi:hypothetical protein